MPLPMSMPGGLDFPYRRPYARLPWWRITCTEDLPMDEWVWVMDRVQNIYPVARTVRGIEVPPALGLPEMVRAGLIGKPIAWLPWTPDVVSHILQYGPALLRRTHVTNGDGR